MTTRARSKRGKVAEAPDMLAAARAECIKLAKRAEAAEEKLHQMQVQECKKMGMEAAMNMQMRTLRVTHRMCRDGKDTPELGRELERFHAKVARVSSHEDGISRVEDLGTLVV